MAEEVAEFPGTRRAAPRYDWTKWTNGSTWRLVRGDDFDIEVDEFRNRLYGVTARRGLKVESTKALERERGVRIEADDGWYERNPKGVMVNVGVPADVAEVLYVRFYGHPDH